MKKGTRIFNALLLCILAFTSISKFNVAQDLQTIIDISNKFKISQNDADTFFKALNNINDNQLENAQLEQLSQALTKARYAKVFEDYYTNNKISGWTTTDNAESDTEATKLEILETKIAQLPVKKTFVPGLEGEKDKLDFSLSKYQYIDDEKKLNELIKSGEIYSISEIFGTTKDGSDGIVYGLIKKRLDDASTEFKNQKGSVLTAKQLEDPANSWETIRSLISKTRTIFIDKVETQQLDKIGIWQKLINSPITPKERAESIKRIVSRELLNGKPEDFKDRVTRFLISLDGSASQEIRSQVASDVLSYKTINKTDMLKDVLTALRQQVTASEVFTNGETVAFKLYNNNKQVFLATNLTEQDSEKKLLGKNVNAAETTAHFKVEIQDGKVELYQENDNGKMYVNSSTCKIEAKPATVDDPTLYHFFVHGSRSNLTLQSAKSIDDAVGGGAITVGVNNSVKTQSEGLAIIRFTPDGKVEQTPWNTFQVIPITTAINLLGQYKEQFDNTLEKVSTSAELETTIKNYSQILSLFLSPTQNPETYVDAIMYILQQAENASYHTKILEQKELITDLVNSCIQAFEPIASQNAILDKKLSDLKYKLEVNLSKTFIAEPIAGSPEAGQVIALMLTNNKYLIVRKDPILGGKFQYTLEASGVSPSNALSHLEVVAYKSIIGFKSTLAENMFLSLAQDKNLEFKKLEKNTQTNFEIPFEAEANLNAHFVFESAGDNNKFYIKNVGSGKYISEADGKITLSNTKTEFSFVIINDFYRELGLIESETNVFVKLERYLNLINFALTDKDRNFILFGVEKIIDEKKQDLETWNNFLSNQEAIDIIDQIFSKLGEKLQDKTDFDRIFNKFQNSFAVDLKDFVGKEINISWRDSNGEYFYLSTLNPTDSTLNFKSNSPINSQAVLELEIDKNDNNILKIKKYETTKYLTFDTENEILKFMAQASKSDTYNQEFTYQGDISLIALQPKMKDGDPKAGYFIAVKPDKTTSFSPGINQNGKFIPFGYKQQFSINVYSELEKKLIEAKEKFNLDVPNETWESLNDSDKTNDATALANLKSQDTKTNLIQRLDFYDQLLNEITLDTNKYSFEDKLILFKELENFVSNLTTKLGGSVYIELLANPDIYDFFDQTILSKVAQISLQDSALKNIFERIAKSWDEGYLGSLTYKTGDAVALVIDNKYLRAVEETYQGTKYIQLKADSSNYLNPQTHFEIYVYKNKIGIKSKFFDNRFLTSPAQVMQTDVKVLSRLNMEFFDLSKKEFGATGSEQIQFELNGPVLQSFVLGEMGNVVQDNDDGNFIKLSALAENFTSSFTLKKIDPIYEKISQVKQSDDLVEQMLIFMEILDEKYITADTTKDDFVSTLEDFTKNLKSNPEAWKEFSLSQENFDNMAIIFALMEEEKDRGVLSEGDITRIKDAFAGYVKTPIGEVAGKKVVISWTDVDGQVYYMHDNNNKLSFNSQDKLDPKNSLDIKIKNEANEKASDEKITINEIVKELTALGGFTNLAFKDSEDNFLSVNRVSSSERDINYVPGVKVSEIARPLPNLQVFSLQVLSELENSLVEVRGLKEVSAQIDSYIFIAKNLANKNSKEDTKVFFKEMERFILEKTQDLSSYNEIKANSNLDYAMTSLLAALTDLAKNDTDLEKKALEMIQNWQEGFVDSAPDNAPENNELIVLKLITQEPITDSLETTETIKFVKIEEKIYQGKIYHTLKAVGIDEFDKLDSSNHFKILQYKGKFGFESQAFKNKTIAWVENSEGNSNLLLVEKNKNEKNSYISFGLPGTENSQFTLEETNTEQRFKIKNLMAKAYIKHTAEQLELSKTADKISFEFYKLTPLDQKLMLARSATDDKAKLNHYLEAITQNYILNSQDAQTLSSQIKIFLEKKKENRETWEKFKSNTELAKMLEQIMQEMENNKYSSDTKNLQSSFDSGFKEPLPEKKTIQLLWNAQDGTKRNLIVVGQTSGDVTTYKLALASSDYVLRENGLFSIEYVSQANDEPAIVLVYQINGTKYYLRSDDSTGSINTYFNLQPDSSENKTINEYATLFDYSGSLKNLSFKSLTLNQGFLTISKISEEFGGQSYQLAATTSKIGDKIEPAGKEIDGRLLPTWYETFELNVVSKTQQELIYIASFMETDSPELLDIADSIVSYIEYPTYYQAANNQVLNLNADDKNTFLQNINGFVQKVVSKKETVGLVDEETKQLFNQLVAMLLQMQWNEEEKNLIKQMSFAWERGYLGDVNQKAPAHESIFAILQGEINITKTPETENEQKKENSDSSNNGFGNSIGKDPSTTRTQNEDTSKQAATQSLVSKLKVVVARENDDLGGSYCLSLAPENEEFAALSKELEYEKFLLENDPFSKAAQFKAMVSGDIFGLKSVMLENMALASEEGFAKFVEENFYQDFGTNNQHFKFGDTLSVASDESLQLNVDSVTKFFKIEAGNTQKLMFLELSTPVYQNLLEIRNLENNKEKLDLYSQSVELVKTKEELQLLLDDLIRFLAGYKQKKEHWNQLINASAFVEMYVEIMQNLKKRFGLENSKLKMNQEYIDMIDKYTNYLTGVMYPEFAQEIQIEETIISFDQLFNVLKNRIKSIDKNSIDKFIKDLEELYLRRAELDFYNQSRNETENLNYSQKVSLWLELEAAYASGILNMKMSEKILEYAEKFKSEIKYQDLVNFLEYNLNNHQAFSEERFFNFCYVASKLTDQFNLMKAAAEEIDLKKVETVLKRAMANQANYFMDKQIAAYTELNDLTLPEEIKEKIEPFLDAIESAQTKIEQRYKLVEEKNQLELDKKNKKEEVEKKNQQIKEEEAKIKEKNEKNKTRPKNEQVGTQKNKDEIKNLKTEIKDLQTKISQLDSQIKSKTKDISNAEAAIEKKNNLIDSTGVTIRELFVSWIEELTEPEIYKGGFYLDEIEALATDLEDNWDKLVHTLNYWKFALTKYSQEDKDELGMGNMNEAEFEKMYTKPTIQMLADKIATLINNDELSKEQVDKLNNILSQIKKETGVAATGATSSSQAPGPRTSLSPTTQGSNVDLSSVNFDFGSVQARPER